jgi:hypothetical protein
MQNLVSEAEHQDTTQVPDKRRSGSLWRDQGQPSKRVCTRQAGAVAPAEGSDQQALQQLRQQQDDLSSRSYQSIHSGHPQQHPPQQQQHAGDSLTPAIAESPQQLGWGEQTAQQLPWQSQQSDVDAVPSVRGLSHKDANDQVGHGVLYALGFVGWQQCLVAAATVEPSSYAIVAGACACFVPLFMPSLCCAVLRHILQSLPSGLPSKLRSAFAA